MSINWAEFLKIDDTFLRLAIITSPGKNRALLEKRWPELYSRRHGKIPLSIIYWVLDLNYDDKVPVFPSPEWSWTDVLEHVHIPHLNLDSDSTPLTEDECNNLRLFKKVSIRERQVAICVFRGRQYLVGEVYDDSPLGAWILDLDQIDLNS